MYIFFRLSLSLSLSSIRLSSLSLSPSLLLFSLSSRFRINSVAPSHADAAVCLGRRKKAPVTHVQSAQKKKVSRSDRNKQSTSRHQLANSFDQFGLHNVWPSPVG